MSPTERALETKDPLGTATEQRSPAFRRYQRKERLKSYGVRMAQVLLLLSILVFWEIAPREHWLNPMLTSYPSAIWSTFVAMLQEGTLLQHVLVTLEETVGGFTLGMIIAVAAAAALWWWEVLHRVMDPFIVVANSLPKIALAPIFYIWLGDVASIYGIAIAISVFTTIIMIYSGFRATDADKLKLVRTFGGTKWQMLTKVVLPGNVPTLIGALKVNIGLTLVGVIAGEFQTSKAGLGYLIVYGSQTLQMHLVMVAITILGLMSAAMYVLIARFERSIVRGRN